MKNITNHRRFVCVSLTMVVASLLFVPAVALAQDNEPGNITKEDRAETPSPLPKSMRGRWSNPLTGHSDQIEIDILEMTTPREGKALVTFWPYCRKSETPVVFERKLKAWRFTAANCSGKTEQMHMRVRPVEGKNRMEGWYGRESDGRSVYLEW